MFPCPEDGVTSTSFVFSNPRLVISQSMTSLTATSYARIVFCP